MEIEKGTHSPYYLVGKGIRPEGVFVRQGTAAVPASEAAIRRMIKESDGERFESRRSLNQELSFSAAEKEFVLRQVAFTRTQFVALGIRSVDGVYTNLGLLLSDQCVHTTKVAIFEGTKKDVFLDRREFSGSLLQQLNEAYEFLDLQNRTKATFSGLHRIDCRDYPEVALREALLNSLVHREYSFSGSTLISVFSDRIEFVSLGGLVKGLTLQDILLGISQCRNEKLAAVFYRLKLVEAYGTGLPKIIESYEESLQQPRIELSENVFKIVLPNRNYFDRQAVPVQVTRQEEAVLALAKQKKGIVRKDVEDQISISSSMAGRIVKRMVDKGLLQAVGKGRNRYYLSR